MAQRPNVLLIIADQHRGDAVGIDPHCPTNEDGEPIVHSPNLNHLPANGGAFTRAYTPIPSCVPARRCLWTGQTPATNGCPNWTTETWDFPHTLPGVLSDDGYQTWLVGKSHSQPLRNHFGFQGMDLHAAGDGDYARWLAKQRNDDADEISHGVGRNSWDARPNHLPEAEHPTNWTTNRALEFLQTQDPTRPFFLTVSFHRPHQPFDALPAYWDLYAERELPEPVVGDWVPDMYGDAIPRYPRTNAWCADLPGDVCRRARMGYYGNITHIDHQLNRIFGQLSSDGQLENTLIIYTADHGEMLGDHNLWRKTYAYEGSARVPFLVKAPEGMDTARGSLYDQPVGLEDVMPTVLDATDTERPDTVEGRSVLELMRGGPTAWRQYYHGEHGPIYDDQNACQWIVTSALKYIWNPITGEELLFDLASDPCEECDLSGEPEYHDPLMMGRERLTDELEGRAEGFVENGALQPLEG